MGKLLKLEKKSLKQQIEDSGLMKIINEVTTKKFPELTLEMATILSKIERKTWLTNTKPSEFIKTYNEGRPLSVSLLYADFTDREKEDTDDEIAMKVAFIEMLFERLGMQSRSYMRHNKDRCYDLDLEITVMSSGQTFDWGGSFRDKTSCHGNHTFPMGLRRKINKIKKFHELPKLKG